MYLSNNVFTIIDLGYSFQIVLFCNKQRRKCGVGAQSWKLKPKGLTAIRWDFLPVYKTGWYKVVHFYVQA